MRTSACCPAPSKTLRSGFTLIEVLVVLVIIGLLAGVALPRLYQISQSYAIATEREGLLSDIGSLGYSAYSSGKSIQLAASADASTYAIKVPPGWRVEVPEPIRYSFNGTCGGGNLVLQAPDGTRDRYVLTAPACKPVPAP